MDIKEYPWISIDVYGNPKIPMDIHGYGDSFISMDIHGHPWISTMDIHGYPWPCAPATQHYATSHLPPASRLALVEAAASWGHGAALPFSCPGAMNNER